MAFKAILTVQGSRSGKLEFDVSSCNFNFRRNIDTRGKVTSAVQDGLIHLEIESTKSAAIFGYICTNELLTGKIVFYKAEDDQRMKQVEFKNAFIVQYGESMLSIGTTPMTTTLTISAQEITIEGEKISWQWQLDGKA